MPSRSPVLDLMFHAKASRRCLGISSARTFPGYRLIVISSLAITHLI
ncbi:hypothetical protein SFA71_06780 [Legionella pneumophila subsp. fraseri]|nr:hypothetical protein [Legionella pneumophila subsp. fraseri]MDW9063342.1 hypothetical protein [Legionella pneumophila subsp. fraseri]